MIIAYARTSTVEQKAGLEAHERDLRHTRCERNSSEQSDVDQRHRLQEALDIIRDGDVLVVTKLDRLARSVVHLTGLVATLKKQQVGLRILSMGADTNTPQES